MYKIGSVGVTAVKNRLASRRVRLTAKPLTKRYAIRKTKERQPPQPDALR